MSQQCETALEMLPHMVEGSFQKLSIAVDYGFKVLGIDRSVIFNHRCRVLKYL